VLTDIGDLKAALWNVFRAEIGTGEPVFFCFSQETLKVHLSDQLLDGRSPLDLICAAAGACYEVYDNDVLLRRGVLSPVKSGFSMAIVLVCQQVLAVEEMVRDGSRYSENAYFPRLRSLISPRLAQLSQNPFSFLEFESIWRTFSREILRIPGSRDDTITFEFDSYSGINKARRFPLSQALLSRADLAEIVARCRLDRLRRGSATDAWVEIRRERIHLSRRGQRLVNSGFLRDRLIEQVQSYARRVAAPESRRPQSLPRNELDLAICLDLTDWAVEAYAAFLIAKDGSRRVDDDSEVRAALAGALGERNYAFCAMNDFGDYWSFDEGVRQVAPGETMVLIGTAAGIERGRAVLDGASPSIPLDDSRIRPLGIASNIHICPVGLPLSLVGFVLVRAGRIVADVPHARAASYEWVGGVCLDRRSRKFMREGLPLGVRFGHQEFRIDEVNGVENTPINWDGLRDVIWKLEADASFDLRFGAGEVARLSIAVAEAKLDEDAVGFLIDTHGRISPTLERMGESDAGVVGFLEQGTSSPRQVSTRTIAALLRDLRTANGRALTAPEIAVIRVRVQESGIPRNVKATIAKLLQCEPKVGESVLADLLTS
jgi:hypothetical protein